MTIIKAIERADTQINNAIPAEEKLRWLSALDGQLYSEVISHYAGAPSTMPSYSYDGDMSTELMVPAPYDELYVDYLVMRIHLAHGDIDRYNAAAALYNNDLKAWQRQYNSTHSYVNGKNPDGTYWVYGLRF